MKFWRNYMTSNVEKTTEELVAEYLAKGGKITGPKSKKKEPIQDFANIYKSR